MNTAIVIIAVGISASITAVIVAFVLVWAIRHITAAIKELTNGIQAAYQVGFRHGFFRQEGYDPDAFLKKAIEKEQKSDGKPPKRKKKIVSGD